MKIARLAALGGGIAAFTAAVAFAQVPQYGTNVTL